MKSKLKKGSNSGKLNIGCGGNVLEGWVNADIEAREGVEKANVMGLPYKNGRFDEILCENLLEHVEDPFKAVSELRRVLKKGGRIRGEVPMFHPYHSNRDYWRFTHQGIELLFKDFSKIQTKRKNGNFAVMGMFAGKAGVIFNLLDRIKKVGNRSCTTLLFEARK